MPWFQCAATFSVGLAYINGWKQGRKGKFVRFARLELAVIKLCHFMDVMATKKILEKNLFHQGKYSFFLLFLFVQNATELDKTDRNWGCNQSSIPQVGTLNTDYLLWQTQLIVCAVNVKSWFFPFTFQAYTLPHTLNCMCVAPFKFHIWILEQF